MRSFDFYVTLVVLMVANPADIFSVVGERLNIPDFRSMRITAEVAARSALGGEVTFQQIYDYVPLASDLKERARSLEFDLERSLVVPVAVGFSQIRTGGLIVSYIYPYEGRYPARFRALVAGRVPGGRPLSGSPLCDKTSGW